MWIYLKSEKVRALKAKVVKKDLFITHMKRIAGTVDFEIYNVQDLEKHCDHT